MDLSQVPLLEDLPVEKKPQGEQVEAEEDNPSFWKLMEEIEAHNSNADVIDGDNPRHLGTVLPPTAPIGSVAAKTAPNPVPLVTKQSPNA